MVQPLSLDRICFDDETVKYCRSDRMIIILLQTGTPTVNQISHVIYIVTHVVSNVIRIGR